MEESSRPVLRRFVVFEGLDGSGTTTQLKRLESALSAAAIPHWTTFEPTSLPTGKLVRQVLKGEVEARPETLARLYSADRHEHLYGRGGILERLGRGELIVGDRYILSSLAYQGVSCGPDLPRLLNSAFPLPELLVYFDVPATLSMGRVEGRGEKEIFETLAFQEKVRKAYEESLAEFGKSGMRILRIDASRSIEAVSEAVMDGIASVLGVSITH